jgi:hypothetical protein|tara:strand:+ start:1366 stop:2319 length:954 start_codon:yes stop_codon:yes gene_type:complete
MRGYSDLRNLGGKFTKNASSGNLTHLDELINDSIRAIATLNGGKWWWLETTETLSTVATQNNYQIPNPIRTFIDLYITLTGGTTIYSPQPVYDSKLWKRILAANLGDSDVAQFYYREGNQVFIEPAPAVSTSTITFRGRTNVVDLNIADATTMVVTDLANGATAATVSTLAATADMVGRFIRITKTTAAGGGDGFWYEIGSFTNSTTIGLLKPYEGTTLSSATAASEIIQVSLIPESYDIAPVYRATALYFQEQGKIREADRWWRLYDGGMEAGLARDFGGIMARMIEEQSGKEEGVYIAPEYSLADEPMSELTGFT